MGPKSLVHPMSSPIGSPGNVYRWGRGITNCIENDFQWSRDFLNKVPELSYRLSKYGFPLMNLQVHNSSKTYLRINHANMKKFSRCIDSSNHHVNVIRHYALVSQVALKNGFVQVTFLSDKGQSYESEFNFVIICAGPINSFNLVSKSGLIPNIESANYLDHPTIWLGDIKTKKSVFIHSHLQNRKITYGTKPGAIVISNKDYAVTIRVRPDLEKRLSRRHDTLVAKTLRFFWRQLKVFGFFSTNFSVAISFDLRDTELRSVLSKNRQVSELRYRNFGPKIDQQLLKVIDDVIKEDFGVFEKTWENDTSIFEEFPSAHYAGFLGLLKDDKNDNFLDGFRLKKVPQISLPGSVSFPGPVIGHPTYLALLSVLYEVDRINAVHLDH
jgi:hypothetical protein